MIYSRLISGWIKTFSVGLLFNRSLEDAMIKRLLRCDNVMFFVSSLFNRSLKDTTTKQLLQCEYYVRLRFFRGMLEKQEKTKSLSATSKMGLWRVSEATMVKPVGGYLSIIYPVRRERMSIIYYLIYINITLAIVNKTFSSAQTISQSQ